MSIAIEINDAGLCAAAGSKGLLDLHSPGIALLDGATLRVGSVAAESARLRPTHVHDRFWAELGHEPLSRPFPREWSAADLAHAHLADFRAGLGESVDDGVVLVLPGSFSAQSAALLLGIARAAGLPVDGLVDSAVAALARGRSTGAGPVLHVDLELHRAVLTSLVLSGGVVRERVELLEGLGLRSWRDAVARTIAELFVRETRFDPLHSAESEQALHLLLPAVLDDLTKSGATDVVLPAVGGERRLRVTREEISQALEPLTHGLATAVSVRLASLGSSALAVSHRVAALPGVTGRFEEASTAVATRLPVGAAVLGAVERADDIRSGNDALLLVVRLGSKTSMTASDSHGVGASEGRRGATHALIDGVAHSLLNAPLAVGVSIPSTLRGVDLEGEVAGISRHHCTLEYLEGRATVTDCSTWGTFLNDQKIEAPTVVHAGDRVRLGSPGVEIRMIALAEEDGSA